MKINLFTFIAQIVNFLILVFILYKILFKRLLNLLDERQKKVQDELDEAKKQMDKANAEKENYEKKNKELADKHDQLLDEMKKEIATQKNAELEAIQKELSDTEKKWKEALFTKEADFISFLKKQAALMSCTISREVLKNFANISLEEAVAANFQTQLEKLSDADKKQIREKYKGEKVTFKSAFQLNENQQKALKENLQKLISAPLSIEFIQDPALTLGFKTKISDIELNYNIENYLQGLEDRFNLKTMVDSVERGARF